MPIESQTSELPTAVLEAIHRVWGFSSLRPMQQRAIEVGIDGRDCLTVLPTGGGKSLCYQVPALVTGLVTIVASPLIALMRDQVRGLELNGYKAAALHSGVDPEEAREIITGAFDGSINLIFAAPERLVTPSFKTILASLHDAGRLGGIAIDEAHCISQWGHDFRPEYRRLKELREVAPGIGMQAFTATATPRVREDIAQQLGLVDAEILVGKFDRPNLTYRVQSRGKKDEQIAEAVRRHRSIGDGGGTIVYCLSRKDTEGLAQDLVELGLDADAYHAGLSEKKRMSVEQAFLNETLDVVVATVAFGMGIDRSNVRLVVHALMPKSVEAYQQETGRAGRDGEPAECLLLYSPSDAGRWERLIGLSAEESGNDPAGQLKLIREMRSLVASMGCRHCALSEYFGQKLEIDAEDGCGACDVCLGETEVDKDSAKVAQILLSVVARTGQRYGAVHICDVARGAKTEKLLSRGHDELSVHGMLGSYSKAQLSMYLDQLISMGALERVVEDRFETLRFGEIGMSVMKGVSDLVLSNPIGTGSAKKERTRGRKQGREAITLDADQQVVFERLRGLRTRLAREMEVPPYVVFSDATLRELIKDRPTTRHEMLRVKGIGRAKWNSFGEAFLEALGVEE
ncbi:MAG: RecQ family ATP-dependent DNA helicase [Phycisphaerales bacterium]|nr:RecQ family ATP-dependent DNA helicase [Phycisphaerales bacterium]